MSTKNNTNKVKSLSAKDLGDSTIPYFIDTTLRDGEQAAGVVFSLTEKIRIAEMLDWVGVPEIEIGTPAMGEKETEDIRQINKMGFNFKTLAWCRANYKDIKYAVRSGTDGIHLSFPVSSILLQSMNKDSQWVIRQLKEMILAASEQFSYVTIGAQDASRADIGFLKDYVSTAASFGVLRVRLADTVGILNPVSTHDLVSHVKTVTGDIPVEIHAHNDLGMATANTVAAFLAGAKCLSTTINGLGERAGNAPFEEVVMALEMSANTRCGFDTTMFQTLSDYVSKASRRIPGDSKPITGKMVYSHESGIHTNSLLKDRSTYQLFQASRIGRKEDDFVIGKHSGKASLTFFMNNSGLTYDDEFCVDLLEKVKQTAEILKRGLSKKEFFDLYTELYLQKTNSKSPIIKA